MLHSRSTPKVYLFTLLFIATVLALIPSAKSTPLLATISIPDTLDARTLSLTNLTLTTNPTYTNLTLPVPPIICYPNVGTTRHHISLTGCASILFILLATEDVVPFQLFNSSRPWRLPAEYVDSEATCEMRLTASEPTSSDNFPLSHVLQTAARIVNYCQHHYTVNLGGYALLGPKQEFLLEVFGPAREDEVATME